MSKQTECTTCKGLHTSAYDGKPWPYCYACQRKQPCGYCNADGPHSYLDTQSKQAVCMICKEDIEDCDFR